MALTLVTAPAEFPVTMAEAKEHLRVNVSDDDATIAIYLQAAIDHAEEWTGRAFIDQVWDLTLDEFPPNELLIPKPPLIEIQSIYYDDSSGNQQLLDAADYSVDAANSPAWVVPASAWPATFSGINAVRIRFRAGYLDQSVSPAAQNVPFGIRAAILLETGEAYAQREMNVIGQLLSRLTAWESLLRPYRVNLGMA